MTGAGTLFCLAGAIITPGSPGLANAKTKMLAQPANQATASMRADKITIPLAFPKRLTVAKPEFWITTSSPSIKDRIPVVSPDR